MTVAECGADAQDHGPPSVEGEVQSGVDGGTDLELVVRGV